MTIVAVVFGILFAVGLVAFILWFAEQQRAAWLQALEHTARTHGLVVHPGSWLKGPTASAELDDHSVLVDTYTVSTGKSSSTYTRVRVWRGLPEQLSISREGFMARVGKAIGASDVEVGDPTFDAAVVLRGEPSQRLLSRLDAPARAAILRATSRGAALEGGTWKRVEGGMVTDPHKLASMVGDVLDAARALARTDRAPAEGLRTLLQDPEPGVRLRAACALSDVPTLRALLHGAPAEVRRGAAVALVTLKDDDDAIVGELVDALERPEEDVIDALGKVGTVEHVAALRAIADAHVSLGRISRSATGAIRAIQARIEGANAGSLALAEGGAGELSEAPENPRGRLSRPRRQEQ